MFRSRRNHHYGGHHRQSNFALYLLAAQLFQVGFNHIPPVTLVSILGQVAIFLKLIPLKRGFPPIRDICISTHSIIFKRDIKRLITAPFFHLDDWHLYYNMVSFLWKGIHLEREYGSPYFGYLIVVFSVLTSALTAGLGLAAQEFTGNDYYTYQCAAGFSGVIFALKVLTTYNSHGTQMVMGMFPVPGPYICWAELFLIQLISPNVSFIGHLAGIIIGLLYVKGPLKSIMDSFVPPQPSYTYMRGTSTTYGSAGPQRPSSYSTRQTHRAASRSGWSFWPFNNEATGWVAPEYRRHHQGQTSYTYTSGTTGGSGSSDTQRQNNGANYYGNLGSQQQHQPAQPYQQDHNAYTGGLSEEEQMRRAMEESRRTAEDAPRRAPTAPPPPPSYEEVIANDNHRNNLYPNLPPDADEVRRRRLQRFT